MTSSLLEHIGGEESLRQLVNDFYDLIETIPEGQQLRKLHLRGHGFDQVRSEQFHFLSGFFGGRRYYEELHGHMNLRDIHGHVPITVQDAEDWLFCMDRALATNGLCGPRIDQLRAVFRRICLMLVNEQ